MPALPLSDRVCGALLAGAVGDAMGSAYEGEPGPIRWREERAWRLSDDTQLTLATCEAIRDAGQVSPERIAGRCLDWFRSRRLTGLGASTLKALRDLDAGAHWALAGARGERAAGAGAAMRAAPLAFCLDPEVAEQRTLLRDVCRITHHHDEAYVGALAVVIAIRWLNEQAQTAGAGLLTHVARSLPDSQVRDRLQSLAELPADIDYGVVAGRYGRSGFVADVVPLALLAAEQLGRVSLHDLLRTAISAGGDADTRASIAGQVAGSALGAQQLPAALLERLPERGEIERIGREFATALA